MTDTTTPDPNAPKQPHESLGVLSAALAMIAGFLTSVGVTSDVIEFIGLEAESIVGVGLTIFGLVSGYARLRANKTIKL